MLRILRLLSYAAVIVAIWLGSLQLDLSRNVRISLLAVSASVWHLLPQNLCELQLIVFS